MNGFNGTELRQLCFDEPEFRPLRDQLLDRASKVEIIDWLLEYAERKLLLESLLVWADKNNPAMYKKHKPYHSGEESPSTGNEGKYKVLWQTETGLKPKHLFASPDYVCLADNRSLQFFSTDDGKSLIDSLTTVGKFSLAEYEIIGGAITPSGNLLLTAIPHHPFNKAYLLVLEFTKSYAKGISVRWFYEAKSTQLSVPVIDNETVYLIEGRAKLVTLDINSGQMQHTISLPESTLHEDYVSFVFAADRFCLALYDGTVMALSLETALAIQTLYEDPNKYSLSPLATDGRYLFFGSPSIEQEVLSPSRVYAIDTLSGRKPWGFELPPDPLGRHRPIEGKPLVVNNTVCITGSNHFLHVLDIDTGRELWRYEMPHRIELGPEWTGHAVVVADRKGGIRALQFGTPEFIVSCHYDLSTPPVLNEWNPLIFTLINTGYCKASDVILNLSGNFEGSIKYTTQQFSTIFPGDCKHCQIRLKPTDPGSVFRLAITIYYKYDDQPGNQML